MHLFPFGLSSDPRPAPARPSRGVDSITQSEVAEQQRASATESTAASIRPGDVEQRDLGKRDRLLRRMLMRSKATLILMMITAKATGRRKERTSPGIRAMLECTCKRKARSQASIQPAALDLLGPCKAASLLHCHPKTERGLKMHKNLQHRRHAAAVAALDLRRTKLKWPSLHPCQDRFSRLSGKTTPLQK